MVLESWGRDALGAVGGVRPSGEALKGVGDVVGAEVVGARAGKVADKVGWEAGGLLRLGRVAPVEKLGWRVEGGKGREGGSWEAPAMHKAG